jgi:hypothetical protein
MRGSTQATWQVTGGYEPWDRERIVVDTAGSTVADNVRSLRERLGRG